MEEERDKTDTRNSKMADINPSYKMTQPCESAFVINHTMAGTTDAWVK